MQTSQENMYKRLRSMPKYITILILILLSVPGLAQQYGLTQSEKRIAYENALLDSAYRFELIKPILFKLTSAYEFRGKEIEDLQNALRMSQLQNAMQKQGYEAAISEERKSAGKGYWKGFKHGFGSGFFTGFLTGQSVH